MFKFQSPYIYIIAFQPLTLYLLVEFHVRTECGVHEHDVPLCVNNYQLEKKTKTFRMYDLTAGRVFILDFLCICYTKILGPKGPSFIAEAASLCLPMVSLCSTSARGFCPLTFFNMFESQSLHFLHPNTVFIHQNVGFLNNFLVELHSFLCADS